MKAIATYQRVSTEEQARDTDAMIRQGWQLDREAAKFPDRVRLHFQDIQSGRRDDRPDMLKLIAAIESEKIDILIVARIDRIGRDLESNSRLQKQLQRKGVKVYEDMLGRFLDWKNPNDWRYFAQAGLDSEGESRMLSARIRKTFEWQRSLSKMGGGMVGFPYKRDENGFIIPDPSNWEIAIECIKIVMAHEGATMPALAQIRDLGIDRTRAWLSNWIRSPLLRGHTPINTRSDSGNKKRINEFELFFDTHISLFSDPRLVGAQKQVDRIIEDSNRYKGKARTRHVRALSGLIYCARCGCLCHIKTSANTRYPQKYTYASCSQRTKKGANCGGEYGVFDGVRKAVNTAYSDIEIQVILELTNKATELIDLAIATEPTSKPEHPDISKLKAEINRLVSFADPDLDSAILKKTEQLNKLLLLDPDRGIPDRMRDEFIEIFASGDSLSFASEIEKQTIYRDWVRRIEVDRQTINVVLAI